MDKLELGYLGGDPDSLDDLEFLQNALSEAIKGLASAWQHAGLDVPILSGLESTISGTTVTFTNGYIVVNSEVYFVIGGTFNLTDYYVIEIGDTFDSNGDETFENLSVNQTWRVRRGVMQLSTGSGTEIDFSDTVTSTQALITQHGFITNQLTSWTTVSVFGSGWSNNAGTNLARYRKNKIGQVEITGVVKNPTASGQLIFQLPVGFRPANQMGFIVMSTDDVGTQFNQILINTSGNITLFGTFGTNKVVNLNLPPFPTD